MNDAQSIVNEHGQWKLFSLFGIENNFFNLSSSIIIATWIAMAGIVISAVIARFILQQNTGLPRYIVITFFKNFMHFCEQSLGFFHYRHFSFITALFLFILYCNLMGIIPFAHEPTADLNTTLALGILSFFYINLSSIEKHGIKKYIAGYFKPFVFMLPLTISEKFSSIISISFRLFGNLLGGSVIMNIYTTSFGVMPTAWYLWIIPLIGSLGSIIVYGFFGIFEGVIQAFVFTTLSLTFLSMELKEGGH